jgi:CRISPR-associated protein Cas1
MRKLLNTLYVTTQGAYLSKDGETLEVRVDGETRLQLPIHTLSGLVCFGQVGMSPALMHLCAERNVTVSLLSERGRFLARVVGGVRGNVLLRREQFRRADDETAALAIARLIVAAKVTNARGVIQRAARELPAPAAGPLQTLPLRLAASAEDALKAASMEQLRGIEGDAARAYFDCFDAMICGDRQAFRFETRTRRPPLDPVNAILSFVYTLLVHDYESALESVGLDPCVGFLHTDRPGRPSLALDLMEELRPALADRFALTLINRRQVAASGFQCTPSGAVLMDDATRKELLVAWQKRKQEEIAHPFLGERMAIGLIPFIQAQLLARHLRGDLDAYPPFFWK